MIFANNPGDFALFVEEIIPEISGQRGPVEEIDLCEDCGAALDDEGCPFCLVDDDGDATEIP